MEYIFYHSGFLTNFVLALKNRVALEFFTVLNILFTFRSFEQLACACPEKQRVPWIHNTDYIFFIIQDFWATCAFPQKRSCHGIFHCIEIFFIIQDFWATCACPEKQSCLEMFRCMEYTFYIQNFWAICMRLPWKTELPWYFHCIKHVFFMTQEFWVTALSRKQSCPEIFRWMEYTFDILNFWATCIRLPWKTELPWYFHCIKHVFFITQEFWATRACPEKQSCPDIFHCIEHVFFIIQEFWVTCAGPENRGFPGIFHCIEHAFFITQDFWATSACPEKQSCPEIFLLYGTYFLQPEFLNNLRLPWKTEGALNSLYWMYFFIIQDFWVTCACPEKQRVPWIQYIECILFIIQDFWATCACPEKQRVPWNFSLSWIYFLHSEFLSN